MEAVLERAPVGAESKKLNLFERYLSLWVGGCMVAGIIIGKTLPELVQTFRGLEFGEGSHINLPIAVLIWLMIIPMMMKVDFASIRNVGRRPKGLAVTLVVNWLVKPFSMAFFAWLFFRYIFAAWVTPAEADQYIAGSIILAAAPCTAMVFVWSYLTDGDPAYTLVQVSVNDLIMLVLFAPIVGFLVSGASSLTVPFEVLLYSVIAFIVIPLTIGTAARLWFIRQHGKAWFETNVLARFGPDHHCGAAADAGADLRLPSGKHYRETVACGVDRHSDFAAGLPECLAGLWADALAQGAVFGRGTGRLDRGQQLF